MSVADCRRRNFEGNVEDDEGGSYYVTTSTGRRIAGPFGVAAYATKVKSRMTGSGFKEPLDVEYDPSGPEA